MQRNLGLFVSTRLEYFCPHQNPLGIHTVIHTTAHREARVFNRTSELKAYSSPEGFTNYHESALGSRISLRHSTSSHLWYLFRLITYLDGRSNRSSPPRWNETVLPYGLPVLFRTRVLFGSNTTSLIYSVENVLQEQGIY